MQEKVCLRCSKTSTEVPFTMIKETGKYRARCRTCSNIEQKENRLANLDVRKKREQKYREDNRAHIRTQYLSKEYAHDQYLKNQENILARHNKYNKDNASKIKKQKHQYYLKNKKNYT